MQSCFNDISHFNLILQACSPHIYNGNKGTKSKEEKEKQEN